MAGRPYLEQVLELVRRFLVKCGHGEVAAQLGQLYEVPEWAAQDNPLLKKGLSKVVKEFIQHNHKAEQYYSTRHEPSAQPTLKKDPTPVSSPRMQLRSDGPQQAPRSEWMAKFDRPKRLEDIDASNPKASETPAHTQAAVKHSKKAVKQVPVIESSDYESEQDSFELEPPPKPSKKSKREGKEEKKKEKESVQPVVKERVEPIKQAAERATSAAVARSRAKGAPARFFSRINPEELGELRTELRDNSFGAKERFGQEGDRWGEFGYNKLKDTRGEGFKKTKGKLKNRAFQGAMMDVNKINSIPIA